MCVGDPDEAAAEEFRRTYERLGVPFEVIRVAEQPVLDGLEYRLILIGPDLHIMWRGQETPHDVDYIVAASVGSPTPAGRSTQPAER